jgi:hypothetical protein
MQAITPRDILPVVRDRAHAETGSNFPGALALWQHASALWDDEFETYQALWDLGLKGAARAAWERSKAAGELTCIYVTAL